MRLIGMAVIVVMFEVVLVLGVEVGPISNDQQILGVGVLRVLGKVKAAGQQRMPIDENDLVVRDVVFRVDERRDPIADQLIGRRVFGLLAFVQDGIHGYAPLVGSNAGFRDRLGRKRIRLNQHDPLGLVDFMDDGVGTASIGREEDLDIAQILCRIGGWISVGRDIAIGCVVGLRDIGSRGRLLGSVVVGLIVVSDWDSRGCHAVGLCPLIERAGGGGQCASFE